MRLSYEDLHPRGDKARSEGGAERRYVRGGKAVKRDEAGLERMMPQSRGQCRPAGIPKERREHLRTLL